MKRLSTYVSPSLFIASKQKKVDDDDDDDDDDDNNYIYIYKLWNAFLRIFLHHYIEPQVAGSIPDGVIGIFHWHSTSDRTMALGSTQPLTEMSTRRISWG